MTRLTVLSGQELKRGLHSSLNNLTFSGSRQREGMRTAKIGPNLRLVFKLHLNLLFHSTKTLSF